MMTNPNGIVTQGQFSFLPTVNRRANHRAN